MGTQARAPMPPCHFELKMDLLGRFTIILDRFLDGRYLLLRVGMCPCIINTYRVPHHVLLCFMVVYNLKCIFSDDLRLF
jgi:hypothetical protein